MTHNTILFGPFRLATDPDRLWRGSEEVRLRAKSLSVLAYLARRPGGVAVIVYYLVWKHLVGFLNELLGVYG